VCRGNNVRNDVHRRVADRRLAPPPASLQAEPRRVLPVRPLHEQSRRERTRHERHPQKYERALPERSRRKSTAERRKQQGQSSSYVALARWAAYKPSLTITITYLIFGGMNVECMWSTQGPQTLYASARGIASSHLPWAFRISSTTSRAEPSPPRLPVT
jgi:hypothetical protein